jgi:hypothetical protein
MMPVEKSPPIVALRRALGSSPPDAITQEPFEGNSKHLKRLAHLRPGDRPDVSDLWEYTQDLLYTNVQGSLLRYLLPFCFELWREDLIGTNHEAGGFVEYFYPALANRQILDDNLTRPQSEAVSQFMRETILEEINNQRGLAYAGMRARPYRWIGALTTHAVIMPDLNRLWNAWWELETYGAAVAAVQYISCLMYPENENPIFAPWTRDNGGGPPCLWNFEGHLYTHRWLPENVSFLRETLNPQGVSEVLGAAVDRLKDEPEHSVAAETLADLPLCADILASRCRSLPAILETAQQPEVLLEWPL